MKALAKGGGKEEGSPSEVATVSEAPSSKVDEVTRDVQTIPRDDASEAEGGVCSLMPTSLGWVF